MRPDSDGPGPARCRLTLDSNEVIALLDQGHGLHRAVTRWRSRELAHGWALYPNPQPAALVAAHLAEACRHPSPAFWPAPISLREEGLICWANILRPRQITEACLLALPVSHGGRFATFDQRLGVAVVPAASDADLCVMACD